MKARTLLLPLAILIVALIATSAGWPAWLGLAIAIVIFVAGGPEPKPVHIRVRTERRQRHRSQ